MFEIDWTTEEDRMRRRRKASTIHGWLRMWRGTLAGNERVRQQGRYEMKMARAYRRQKPQTPGGNSGPFSLFRRGSLSNRRNGQASASTPQRHKSSSSKHHRSRSQSQKAPRPTPAQRKSSTSSGANRRQHGHTPARPEPTRHRSSHSAKGRPSRQSSRR